jgi:methyltransferase (TIGR00027 family)
VGYVGAGDIIDSRAVIVEEVSVARQNVSRTALGTAICRLIEQYQPEDTRLFLDPIVRDFIGKPIEFMMRFPSMRNLTFNQTEAISKGIFGAQICRTRYIDEVILNEFSKGKKQLVILGAGYDTRAYRLPTIEKIKVFEIDLPSMQNDKKKKLQKYLGGIPANVTFIPIDFDTQTLESVFKGTAFDPSLPTIFIWEGVTQYIIADSVNNTLAFIGKTSRGNVIVFTYVLKNIIEGRSDIPGIKKMMEVVAKQSPWIFGLEPSSIRKYLSANNLELIADVGKNDYEEKYLRPIGRHLVVFEGERIAYARVR